MDPGNDGQPARTVRDTLSRAFRPGQFFYDLSAAGVKFGVSREEVVNKIVAAAEQHFAGGFLMCVFCFFIWYLCSLPLNCLGVIVISFNFFLLDCFIFRCFCTEWVLDGSLDLHSGSGA